LLLSCIVYVYKVYKTSLALTIEWCLFRTDVDVLLQYQTQTKDIHPASYSIYFSQTQHQPTASTALTIF